jgi:hypothetical protein
MEDILKECFLNTKSSSLPVNGVALQEKAQCIARKLELDSFSVPNGWISCLGKDKILYRSVCGESSEVDPGNVKDWK